MKIAEKSDREAKTMVEKGVQAQAELNRVSFFFSLLIVSIYGCAKSRKYEQKDI